MQTTQTQNQPQQIGLFPPMYDHSTPAKPKPSLYTEASNAELLVALQAHSGKVQTYADALPCPLVTLPPEFYAITSEMGKRQRINSKFTQRGREDCDAVHIRCRLAVAAVLGEDLTTVFEAWERALKRGNKGIHWQGGGNAVGLRTTSGGRNNFSISKNPSASRITCFMFARISEQHDLTARIEVFGYSERYAIGQYLRDKGNYLDVNIQSLLRDGLVNPINGFTAFVR